MDDHESDPKLPDCPSRDVQQHATSEPSADASAEGSGKKPVSTRIEANRRNGRKGGVKTQAGKDRVRWNAWKHGMEATALLMVDDGSETYKEFSQLLRVLAPEFDLSTVEGRISLEQAAIAIQQKRNGRRFEQAEMRDPAAFHHSAMDRIQRYDSAADRRLWRALSEKKTGREVTHQKS